MNVNQIKVSDWNPLNLIQPIKVNGDIFKRDKKLIKKLIKKMKKKNKKEMKK